MKIDSISYERRASDGSYGNRALRASAMLDEQDHPGEVATALRRFVVDQLYADVQEEEERREAERQRQQEEYERKRQERAALMGRDVAITVPAGEDIGEDDIPFDDGEEDDE